VPWRERDKVEEKADRMASGSAFPERGGNVFLPVPVSWQAGQDDDRQLPEFSLKAARDEVAKWAAILAREKTPHQAEPR
jgi:hypothetical protein